MSLYLQSWGSVSHYAMMEYVTVNNLLIKGRYMGKALYG